MVKFDGVFKLTPSSKSDLLEIARYTESQWGIEQRNKYLRKLDECFRLLAGNPHLGKDRSEIGSGYRSMVEGSHVIFYTIKESHIEIISIPHASEDLDNIFSNSTDKPSG